MILEVILRSLIPILLLIVAGFISRHYKIFKAGDEKVFSSYVFYVALPALFFINMAELSIKPETIKYIFATALPPLVVTLVYFFIWLLFRFDKKYFYFLVFSSVFGSYAFFGIPFMLFAFPGREAEGFAVLSSASISMVGVFLTILVLELYKIGDKSFLFAFRELFLKLSKNPLIISIFFGLFFSILDINLPVFISNALHMLGSTTATVSLFMLGLFLYGRKYEGFLTALGITIMRATLMPIIAVFSMSFFKIQGLPATISILMAAMPVAISMIVLSERYDFFKEITATLTLVSTILSIVYLPLWITYLGLR